MDANAGQLIVAAQQADAQQAKLQEAVGLHVAGVSAIPPFELVELRGQITSELVRGEPAGIRFVIAGIGSPRAYVVQVPMEWLLTTVTRLANELAAANGAVPAEPNLEPGADEAAA